MNADVNWVSMASSASGAFLFLDVRTEDVGNLLNATAGITPLDVNFIVSYSFLTP